MWDLRYYYIITRDGRKCAEREYASSSLSLTAGWLAGLGQCQFVETELVKGLEILFREEENSVAALSEIKGPRGLGNEYHVFSLFPPHLHHPPLPPTTHHTPPTQQAQHHIPNDNSSETSPSPPVPQTSSVHTSDYPPQAACDHTPPAPASVDSSHTRQRISGSKLRCSWRWLGGRRRFARCGRRRRRGRGCRFGRIYRGRG